MRRATVFSILKGVAAGVAATVLGMALLALLMVTAGLPDAALTFLNQALKVCALFIGALVAVGRGGTRGFALGAATGLTYMVLCYGLYCALDGALRPGGFLAGEFLIGAGIGALSGAVVANLPARRKKMPCAKRAARTA